MWDYADSVSQGWRRVFPEIDLAAFTAGIRLLRIGRMVEKAIDAAAARSELVVGGDYEVLSTLRRSHPAPLQPATLAGHTMITVSGMTGRLDRLEKEGLVERHRNPSDRRAVDIHLTPAGRDVADRTFREVVAEVSGLLGGVDPEGLVEFSMVLRSIAVGLGDAPDSIP